MLHTHGRSATDLFDSARNAESSRRYSRVETPNGATVIVHLKRRFAPFVEQVCERYPILPAVRLSLLHTKAAVLGSCATPHTLESDEHLVRPQALDTRPHGERKRRGGGRATRVGRKPWQRNQTPDGPAPGRTRFAPDSSSRAPGARTRAATYPRARYWVLSLTRCRQ